jgi:CAAX protease family protein
VGPWLLLAPPGSGRAVALSTCVFLLYHLPRWDELVQGPYAFHLALAGTAFALAYLRNGSLWLGIGLHWGWNLGAYVLLEAGTPLVRLEGPAASGWGEAGSWLGVLGNAVLLLVVLAWPSRQAQSAVPRDQRA